MKPATIDGYLQQFDEEQRGMLQRVREAIHRGAPGGEEKVRYGMPAIMVDARRGLHFAGWKKHIGIYPVHALVDDLERQVAPYRAKIDTLQLKWGEPLPLELIEKIAVEVAAGRA